MTGSSQDPKLPLDVPTTVQPDTEIDLGQLTAALREINTGLEPRSACTSIRAGFPG